MWTTVIAWLIAVLGFLTITTGVATLFYLLTDPKFPPLRWYTLSIALIAGGSSMIGVAECLRLLQVLVAKP